MRYTDASLRRACPGVRDGAGSPTGSAFACRADLYIVPVELVCAAPGAAPRGPVVQAHGSHTLAGCSQTATPNTHSTRKQNLHRARCTNKTLHCADCLQRDTLTLSSTLLCLTNLHSDTLRQPHNCTHQCSSP